MKRILYFTIMTFTLITYTAEAYSTFGSKGTEVIMIQEKLERLGYDCGESDGIYGIKTQNAVISFQKKNNLSPDGICGNTTLDKLNIPMKSEIDLLARVINGEARGECFEGQIAVGAVILNRVKHPSFPNTIYDVIFQKGAFTAVNDGQFRKKVTDSCRIAAIEALNGKDPTNGAIYYYNPKTATCKWIKSRKPIKTIGNHLFCK